MLRAIPSIILSVFCNAMLYAEEPGGPRGRAALLAPQHKAWPSYSDEARLTSGSVIEIEGERAGSLFANQQVRIARAHRARRNLLCAVITRKRLYSSLGRGMGSQPVLEPTRLA